MLTLATAVVIASLLGSMHCVGMCGPLAIWATGGGKSMALVSYHLGRLTTYLSAGLVAGVLGSAIAIGGDFAGMQSLAAKIAGGLLIVVGTVKLAQLTPLFRRKQTTPDKPSLVAGWLHRAKPIIASRGPAARAYIGGLLTTWLPCGWLYLFILVAAGTGGVISALLVMFAFWLGTLPALTTLVLGVGKLVPRLRNFVAPIAGVLLILVGLYTATGRASADLSTMLPPVNASGKQDAVLLLDASERPLPCCVGKMSETSK